MKQLHQADMCQLTHSFSVCVLLWTRQRARASTQPLSCGLLIAMQHYHQQRNSFSSLEAQMEEVQQQDPLDAMQGRLRLWC